MIQYDQAPWKFFQFWEGGLVFYGALIGGVIGYLLAARFVLKRQGVSGWKLADIMAPSIALGLAIGRVGCLLNGCCFGNVAAPGLPALSFPIYSYSGQLLWKNGYQAAAGFTLAGTKDERMVGAVDRASSAARVAGLKAGDVIVQIDDEPINSYADLERGLFSKWPARSDLTLTVQRGDQKIQLPTYEPRTIGLTPTQPYETISMFLLFLLLTAYYPWRRHDGEVLALFLLCYPLHRFLNEMLRNDTDPVAFGMTLSENISIGLLVIAVLLWIWLLRKPAQYRPLQAVPTLSPTLTGA
jgi:phosphatidylglycerol:prolipoprotein diacylglycerol transferase